MDFFTFLYNVPHCRAPLPKRVSKVSGVTFDGVQWSDSESSLLAMQQSPDYGTARKCEPLPFPFPPLCPVHFNVVWFRHSFATLGKISMSKTTYMGILARWLCAISLCICMVFAHSGERLSTFFTSRCRPRYEWRAFPPRSLRGYLEQFQSLLGTIMARLEGFLGASWAILGPS